MSPVPNPEEERDKGPHQEPDNELGDADIPNFIVNQDSDSDEDDEIDNSGYQGYQMLPQDGMPHDEDDSDSSSGDANHFVADFSSVNFNNQQSVNESVTLHQGLEPNSGAQLPSYMQVPDLPLPDPKEHLWNTSQSVNIKMDEGQVDTIKEAMSGFEIPTKNIPEWAREISEDQWKDKLLTSLKSKTS